MLFKILSRDINLSIDTKNAWDIDIELEWIP